MNLYLTECLKNLLETEEVGADPIRQLASHAQLKDISPAVDELYRDDKDLAELFAATALISYRTGFEQGWNQHIDFEKNIRLMDGGGE